MQRAGAASAAEIALRYPSRLTRGVLAFAGPGNNGGDAWVVARALSTAGVAVRVLEPIEAKTADARAERDLALPCVRAEQWVDGAPPESLWRGEEIVIDGLLGTGSSGAPRGGVLAAVHAIRAARARGALVVAIDLPSGLDATTGEITDGVVADLTLTFGTIKRGQLIARGSCGRIVALDIGLGRSAELSDGAPRLVDERWVGTRVPRIGASAHKGTRKKLAIVGGAEGMAGASILAARAAIRSGIGMVRVLVEGASLGAVQQAEPLALAGRWPANDGEIDGQIGEWADGVVLGPGLGKTAASRKLVERVLFRWTGPALLDADALNVFDGELDALDSLVGKRAALLTPHPAELGRLAGCTVDEVLARRFEVGGEIARRVGATVLLKGVPTIVTSPAGESLVSAAGTPALAAAGSGDVLSGIGGTLLTQLDDALIAGAAAAWIHGRASERAESSRGFSAEAPHDGPPSDPPNDAAAATRPRRVRGTTLDDVIMALAGSWELDLAPTRYPVLCELPETGDPL
jgi:NAD(P)H-hydrate epimerase